MNWQIQNQIKSLNLGDLVRVEWSIIASLIHAVFDAWFDQLDESGPFVFSA